MPQSLSKVVVHLVFSTKGRKPSISTEIGEEVRSYLAGVLRNCGCSVVAVGGVEDHVHLLFAISRTITIAQIVEKVKTSSGKWAKEKFKIDLTWQAGYGAFSVGARELDQIATYVRNQELHHAKVSFQDEFRELLTEAGIDWDEKYVWD